MPLVSLKPLRIPILVRARRKVEKTIARKVAEAFDTLKPYDLFWLHMWRPFSTRYYALVNRDLRYRSRFFLSLHIRLFGINEGRIYASPSMFTVTAKERKASKPSVATPQRSGKKRMYSSPILITGFHRSGTSMTASVFSNAGLHLGRDLLGASSTNPYGYYEDREIVEFHDRLLKQSGSTWQSETPFDPAISRKDWAWMMNYGIRRAIHPAWGFKDPRSSLFLRQWASVFPDAKILYIFRPCVDCVHSLKRRAMKGIRNNHAIKTNMRFWRVEDLAVRMYLNYTETALSFLEKFSGDSCVVDLDSFLRGRDIVSEVREAWGYPLGDACASDVFDGKIMMRGGANEFLSDIDLLSQITETENRMKALIERGISRNGRSV